jgi:hypothetical protein
MRIRQVPTQLAAGRWVAGLMIALAISVPMASAQVPVTPASPGFPGLPPGMVPPQLPPIAHERTPAMWPVPDYFDEALKVTGMQAGERAAALVIRGTPDALPPYIVLPVQIQAFGFAPVFRALAGAHLDRQLEHAGIDATRQTDAADAYGPFVRRFDEARIDALVADHPQRKVIALYLGHDGIGQMFVTLVVRSGQQRVVAHRTIAMLPDAAQAIERLAQTLPALLKESGLPVHSTPARAAKADTCDSSTWTLAPPPRGALPGVRACHAITIGSLLPVYDAHAAYLDSTESMSPAKLAWLAQAHVLATPDVLAPATAQAIRDLAMKQLGLQQGADLPAFAALASLDDPVASRLARLKGLNAATEQSPARSAREARNKQVKQIAEGLPAFAGAVLEANANFNEAFSQVDLCGIERELPGIMLRAACRGDGPVSAPSRTAWPAETLLYQEWRLSSHYKAVQHASQTLGSRARADEALARWPADVAAHPYLQRLLHEVTSQRGTGGSFDEQLSGARDTARRVVQTSVDLQRADRWLGGHSLTGHMWTSNLNILNDAQVREASDKEMRLLSVLRFDRFTLDRYLAMRRPGDPPFFIAPAPWLHAMSGGMPQLVVMAEPPQGAIAPSASPPAAYKPSLFSRHMAMFETRPDAELSALLERNPSDLHTRVELAFGRVKDGAAVADAMRLIDARPDDRRPDHRIGESNAWAEPAHLFYFAGEEAAAQRYYRKVADIGTGSESDMMARTRLKLLDGRLRDALDATTARVERYDSDFARRDQAALLFMFGEGDKAWRAFLLRAGSSDLFQLWVGAYTGHRIEGADLPRIDGWLTAQNLDSTQIHFNDASLLYLHLQAVTDRVPSEADIELLKRPRGTRTYVGPRWAASARLVRSAMEGNGYAEAHREATSALMRDGNNPSSSFMLPLYAWVAWQATDGKDEALDEVRRATTRWSFDEMLAKSLVLALEGKTAESMRFYTAARYQLAATSDRMLPGPYSYALAGFLMHRKTGQDEYRRETLRFVRAQQKVFPFYGWLYGMEALMNNDASQRKTAACRAQFLDPNSYFLRLAQMKGIDKAACREALASLLR